MLIGLIYNGINTCSKIVFFILEGQNDAYDFRTFSHDKILTKISSLAMVHQRVLATFE